MELPPDDELKACLEVIRMAVLESRVWGWQNKIEAEQLADLMDAVHNIPSIIQHWTSDSSLEILREIESYDNKWAKSGGLSLKSRYEQFAQLPQQD